MKSMSLSTIELAMDQYQSPLTSRYASKEMSYIFSPLFKHTTWRRLWVALAEAEQSLGLSISDNQINELRANIEPIDFEAANRYEEELQHDVMAHIHAYGDQCPLAKPIIHLGATSCYVTDNTDIIQMREGLALLRKKLKQVIQQFSAFAEENASLTTLSYTHFQPAQPTTVGKRACLWIQDLLLDLEELEYRNEHLRFLGVKGTTGTQASFLALFDGDGKKVVLLDKLVAKKMGFSKEFPISGQTYTRKQDALILNTLSGIAISTHKCATDLRLLAHLREIQEPFGSKQVGSSAMPFKRNPIYTERVCSLARFLISLADNPTYTAATQWFERTLDDSANRRVSISEAFLTCDAILNLMLKITKGLIVNPEVIQNHLNEELPFMIVETILMEATKRGYDRQELHEKLRQHCLSDKQSLLENIAKDDSFPFGFTELNKILENAPIHGRSPEQVHEFLHDFVYPMIKEV